MADKSFGVKKIELLGDGTPTIESPNDLNLNANTVAISTNLSATFQNEGYGASTLYSANDTIVVQLEIRNLDYGSGNKSRLNSG